MSTSKHIDTICIVILLFALVLTGLFMNGEALGITSIVDGDAENGQFTVNDLNAEWDKADVTQITLTGDGGSVKGDGAYVYDGDVHILYAGEYILTGELTNGSVIIDADKNDKIWILLDDVSLHCEDSAAIEIKQAKKVFLTLASGTENSISSGAEYTSEAVSAGIDGAIYSRDDLTINGSGFLSVTAEYKHAIVCNDDLVITGGNMEISAVQDGIHANDSARFADANITINAGDDGITVSNDDETGYIYIESGYISIPSCYEGIEAVDITIAGGVLNIMPTDDGINANGRGSNSVIRITDGDITIINETGRDADGLDSNGDIYISGGSLFISVISNGGSCAIDYGSENGGTCEISGGTVIAAGSSSMAEGFDSSSEQCFIMYNATTASAGTTVSLTNSAGTTLVSETIPCSFSSVIISTPELQMGEVCTLSIGDAIAEITVDNSSNSNGFGMRDMFDGDMQQGGFLRGMHGKRGGRMDQSTDDRPDAGNMDIEENQPQDAPGMFPEDVRPQDIPDMPNGEIPEMPDQDAGRREFQDFSNQMQVPDEQRGQGGMGGNRRDENQFMQRGQNQDWMQGGEIAETSALSPQTMILTGGSILILLAGILIALKVKH